MHAYLLVGGHLRCGRSIPGLAPNKDRRVYQCSSRNNFLDASMRCRGYLDANDAETRVWQAIEAVLQQPGLIAAAVSRQEATADQQRAGVQQELLTLESALAKCDREAQRWAEAYAVEVITIRELKGYRAKIEARCQSLLTQQATCQAQLEAMGQAVRQVEALTGYCARVRRRLQTFDSAEKQLAFEALNIGVMWSPGLPLAIEGTIPFDTIAPTSAPRQRCSLPRRASWRDARV